MKYYRITINGVEYKVGIEKAGNGIYRVRIGDKETDVFIEESVEAKKVERVEKGVRTVLPGTVVRILVKPGDRVKFGDPLMIIESMKMENEITSPKDGVVKKILVKEGQRVEAGETLLIID